MATLSLVLKGQAQRSVNALEHRRCKDENKQPYCLRECTFVETLPNVFLIATIDRPKNQCILELMQPAPPLGPEASLDVSDVTIANSGVLPSSPPRFLEKEPGDDGVIPVKLRAAFRTLQVIRLISVDEGEIACIEMACERAGNHLNRCSAVGIRPSNAKLRELHAQNSTPRATENCRDAFTPVMDDVLVYLFIGTSNGAVLVCNALRGSILMIARFQSHTPRSGPVGDDARSAHPLSLTASPEGGVLPPGSPRSAAVVRFNVQHYPSPYHWSPSMIAGAPTSPTISGVYVVHADGKVAFLDRATLDAFAEVILNRLDGERPRLGVSGPGSAYPASGPAVATAPPIEDVYVLSPVGSYSAAEMATVKQLRHLDARVFTPGCPGPRRILDAAIFYTTETGRLDSPQQTGLQTTEVFVACGRNPAFALYCLAKQQKTFSPTGAVKAAASLLKGAAKSLYSTTFGRSQKTPEPPKQLKKFSLHETTAFLEADSTFSRILVDPTHQYAAFYAEGAGRIYLVEVNTGVVWRVLKGQRSAHFQWGLESSATRRPMLLLYVYLPLRHLVEVYSLRLRRRLASCLVPEGSTLLLPGPQPRGRGAPLIWGPTGEVYQLRLNFPAGDGRGGRSPSSAALSSNDAAESSGCGLPVNALEAYRTPDEFFVLAMQLKLPRWTVFPAAASTPADPQALGKAVGENMEAFHVVKRQLLSICDAIDRLWAPRSTDVRVIQRDPGSAGGVARGITAAQCLNFLQLRMTLIDKYARLASGSCVGEPINQNSGTAHVPSFFQAESFDPSIWECTLSTQDAIAKRFWYQSVRIMSTHLTRAYPSLAKILQKDWQAALQSISQAAVQSDKAQHQHPSGKFIDIDSFLKCFFCGGNQVEFLRSDIARLEDANSNLNVFYDLSYLVFGNQGVNVFHKRLPELSDMGSNLCDLAHMIIAWVAENGSEDVAGLVHRTNLGALCAVMSAFPEDVFITAVERALIPLYVRNASPESSSPRLEVLRQAKGALFAILMCCVAREHSDINSKYAQHSNSWYLCIAQLLHLWVMASRNTARDDKARETNTCKYSVGSLRVGLRLQYLLPRTEHKQTNTFETLLLYQRMPVADVHFMSSLINRSDSPEIARKSRLYALVVFSPLITHGKPSREEEVPAGGVENFFQVKYPWIEDATWLPDVFRKSLLEPLQKEWDVVASVDARETTSKTPVERRWRLLHQCCVFMTAVNCLQEDILRPFKEANLPFWGEQVVPNGGELFIFPVATDPTASGTPQRAFTCWLKGSRSNRDFLACALALSELTMRIADAVLTSADEYKWVSLVKHISTCLAEDDGFFFPTIPTSLRFQLKILMQRLCVHPQLLQFRLQQANAYINTLFFLMDLGKYMIPGPPDTMLKRKLLVPWAELFGDPTECFTLTPCTLLNAPASSPPQEALLSGKNNKQNLEECNALSLYHSSGYSAFLRVRGAFVRSFLLHCITAHSSEESIFEDPQKSHDIRGILRKLCTALGLTTLVSELPELVFLDYQMKYLFPCEQIQRELLYIGDKILLARVAASNARAIIRSCIRCWIPQMYAAHPGGVGVEETTEKLGQLNAIISHNCDRWLQLSGGDDELDFSIERRNPPLAFMVGGDGWVTVDEQVEIEMRAQNCLVHATDTESKSAFMELIFLLVQLANEGKSAFSAEGQAVMAELPKIVEFLRKCFYLLHGVETPLEQVKFMYTSERDAAPYIKRLREREDRIGMHRFLLELLPETRDLATIKPLVSLKTLYSDFVVREVCPRFNGGKPLRLGPLPLCASSEDSNGKRVEKRQRGEVGLREEVLRVANEAFAPLLSQEDITKLLTYLQQGEKKIVLSNTVTDKTKRTAIHQAVKATLADTHVSTTEEGSVVILKATASARREEKRRSRPLSSRPFLHFTLYKENIDSMHAFRTMARHIHISTRQFQYCGTKDKRAVTTQRVAIRDMDPEKLSSVNGKSFGPRCVVKVSSFEEEATGLKLGEACGNYFHIALRVHPCSPMITDAYLALVKASLERVGVINYFGPQRFGTTDVLTSDVGLMLLRGQYKEAIQSIFNSKACIEPLLKEVASLVCAGDYASALKKLPYYCLQERDMLKHLSKHPNDYLGTLQVIPRTLAMLYFHAAQSLIWNRMVSRRLSDETRTAPEVGDLVLASVYKARMAAEQVPEHAENCLFDEAVPDELPPSDERLPAVQQLSAQDDLSRFDLSDILLPVPGPDTELRYPQCHGCTKENYQSEMEALGMRAAFLDDNLPDPLVKIFHYHGTYRPLCVRPQRLQLSYTEVSDWMQPVILTDWEQLKSKLDHDDQAGMADCATSSANEELVTPNDHSETVSGPSSKFQVLIAEFVLPSGSYATAVLREFCVTKSDGFHEDAVQIANASE